jgi:hypothetical protein
VDAALDAAPRRHGATTTTADAQLSSGLDAAFDGSSDAAGDGGGAQDASQDAAPPDGAWPDEREDHGGDHHLEECCGA